MTIDAVQHGRVDVGGALIAAEPMLARLNARAGGREGAPVAVPQIAAIARLASRLRVAVSRAAVAADGEEEIDLWVRAAPHGDGVTLAVSGWMRRARPSRMEEPSVRPVDHADADWTWETDEALRLTALSPAVAGLIGDDPGALIGRPITGLFAFAEGPDGGLPVLAALAERRRFDAQIATLRDAGPARYRLRAVPMKDGGGRFAGFRGAAVRIDAPAPAAEPAADGAFAARLDDALRAPLGRIIANADDLHAQNEGPLRSEYAGYATDIAAAGRHLLSLVDDLVDLQAIERPDFRPERDALDLADLGRRAAGLLGVRAAGKGVRMDAPPSGASVSATGEFRRVLQILVNLVGNAVRYSPPGGVVSIAVGRVGDMAAITVADAGKGIAPADQARIFAKFERVDPSEPGGTGLGLYIARRLARAMGGDLSVASEPGRGATFTLTLPTA